MACFARPGLAATGAVVCAAGKAVLLPINLRPASFTNLPMLLIGKFPIIQIGDNMLHLVAFSFPVAHDALSRFAGNLVLHAKLFFSTGVADIPMLRLGRDHFQFTHVEIIAFSRLAAIHTLLRSAGNLVHRAARFFPADFAGVPVLCFRGENLRIIRYMRRSARACLTADRAFIRFAGNSVACVVALSPAFGAFFPMLRFRRNPIVHPIKMRYFSRAGLIADAAISRYAVDNVSGLINFLPAQRAFLPMPQLVVAHFTLMPDTSRRAFLAADGTFHLAGNLVRGAVKLIAASRANTPVLRLVAFPFI